MEQFKVDTSTARCRVDGVEAKTERDGRPVLDKASGLQKFVVHLSVRDGDRVRPDQWTVTVAGEPKIAVDSYVTLQVWSPTRGSTRDVTASPCAPRPSCRCSRPRPRLRLRRRRPDRPVRLV